MIYGTNGVMDVEQTLNADDWTNMQTDIDFLITSEMMIRYGIVSYC